MLCETKVNSRRPVMWVVYLPNPLCQRLAKHVRFSIATMMVFTGCVAAVTCWFLPGSGVPTGGGSVPTMIMANDAGYFPAMERLSNFEEMLAWEARIPDYAPGSVPSSEPPEYIDFDQQDMLIVPLPSTNSTYQVVFRCLGRITIIHGERLDQGTYGQEFIVPNDTVVIFAERTFLRCLDSFVALGLLGIIATAYFRDRARNRQQTLG